MKASSESNWTESFSPRLWLQPDHTGDADAAFIWKTLSLCSGMRVLDAPCGAGRIGIPLLKFGCILVGIDQNQEFIDHANRQAEAMAGRSTFMCGDIRKLQYSQEFDASFNWGGSFGYFTDSENVDVLKGLVSALTKRGRALVDQPNKAHLLNNFKARIEKERLQINNIWNNQTSRMESDWRIIVDGQERSNVMSIRLYSLEEMKVLLDRAGCTFEKAYGGASRETFNETSKRLIVVGERKAG